MSSALDFLPLELALGVEGDFCFDPEFLPLGLALGVEGDIIRMSSALDFLPLELALGVEGDFCFDPDFLPLELALGVEGDIIRMSSALDFLPLELALGVEGGIRIAISSISLADFISRLKSLNILRLPLRNAGLLISLAVEDFLRWTLVWGL
eukprot:CAMPEP_0113601810 /NCGR_PEP_ID=MMETSP0017_2-20120614/426_1 /TAXON_ID=2856 /ORGANISM="Cylindrotheca closterium" /LENGTH=151 /DNA_ID=CAMNT_0000510125 /DNA_START=635 /DNA_END=1090 /DNA_ORIENTATION=- /assembly_acc=CAM_ASM_000147